MAVRTALCVSVTPFQWHCAAAPRKDTIKLCSANEPQLMPAYTSSSQWCMPRTPQLSSTSSTVKAPDCSSSCDGASITRWLGCRRIDMVVLQAEASASASAGRRQCCREQHQQHCHQQSHMRRRCSALGSCVNRKNVYYVCLLYMRIRALIQPPAAFGPLLPKPQQIE